MPKKLIIANWKALPESLGQAQGILESVSQYLEGIEIPSFTLVVCPPFVFIEEIAKLMSGTRLGQQMLMGAQDIAVSDEPAQTGEIPGAMLAKLGVRYVIVGHSERRWPARILHDKIHAGESNEVVNTKLKAALHDGLTPIVCLGERERGVGFADFLRQQTQETFADLSDLEKAKCIIAYEPVWAISTTPGAKPDTPKSALESIAIIRSQISDTQVLYGGSVTALNVADFLHADGIDGVLVGGASVKKDEFVKILATASKLQ